MVTSTDKAPDDPNKAPDDPDKAPDDPSKSCEVATNPDEHDNVEEELQELITQLKARKCIFGKLLTVDEMLDRVGE